MLYHLYQWMTHLMACGNIYVGIMIVGRKGMMNICPRPNGGFIQMRAREPEGRLAPPPPPPSHGKYNSLNLIDPPAPHFHTYHLPPQLDRLEG